MRYIDRDEVARWLTYKRFIPIVREVKIAFSRSETMQHLCFFPKLAAAWANG